MKKSQNAPSVYADLMTAIEARAIASPKYITLIVPITMLVRDMKMNYATLRFRLAEPMNLTSGDIRKLAALMDMDSGKLFKWINETSNEH